MEYCAVGGEKLAAVRKCKNARSQIACAVLGGLGGDGWAGFGGCVEIARISVCRGLQRALEALILGGLQRFCKIYAKMARFCATICADRFRSCYLKAVPDCAKDLRLGSVCQCSAPMFEAVLRLWAC